MYRVLQDEKNILTKFESNCRKGLDGAAICANFGLPTAIGYQVVDSPKFVRHFTVTMVTKVKCHEMSPIVGESQKALSRDMSLSLIGDNCHPAHS